MRESEKLKQELNDEDDLQLEKNDMKALIISGFMTVGIPVLIMMLLIFGVTVLLFGVW